QLPSMFPRPLPAAAAATLADLAPEQVQAAFADQPDLQFASQVPQQGTGHAVQQAAPLLLQGEPEQDATLVLYGDVPLVQAETLQRLLDARGRGMAVLTETLADPAGYGRIVRNGKGEVLRIVEHKDASAAEHAINEVNTGILVAPTGKLIDWLARIDNT
ncbi:MAG: NTP transferase domain-containing protein, partial [Pollutimonas bauzanensis]